MSLQISLFARVALLVFLVFFPFRIFAQAAKTQPAIVYEDQKDFRKLVVSQGQTFSGVLQGVGLSYREILTISETLKPHFNANTVQPGQQMYYRLSGKKYPLISELRVDLGKQEARYIANDRTTRLTGKNVVKIVSPQIVTVGSLRENRRSQIALVEDLFATHIDSDDGLSEEDGVMFYSEHYEDEYGQFVKGGPIRYLAVRSAGKIYQGYLFDGDYFNPTGDILKRALFTLPLKIRISVSSYFGWRTHPLTRRKEFHPAIDLRAPIGTPIYAATTGEVVEATFDRWLGRHMILKHKGGFFTLYAHMSAYKDGLKIGDVINEGDEIGLVGDTGVVTGPHLHFAILKNKEPLDPRRYWSTTPVRHLNKEQKSEFTLFKENLDKEMRERGISPGSFGLVPVRKVNKKNIAEEPESHNENQNDSDEDNGSISASEEELILEQLS
ncbi:MAG: M23 family metallopeptidase [Spirochaetia bacterium]